MKKIWIILMILMPAIAYAEPAIKFESETYDFGHVVQGELLIHTFEFSNEGTEELVIERIESS